MPYVSSDMQPMAVKGAEPSFTEFHITNTDSAATINTSGYVSDAVARGVKVGDTLLHTDANTYAKTLFVFNALNADGSADLTDGTVISTGTDTD